VSKTTNRDLRVLICEDEYLLAMDMAQQFEALHAQVTGIVGNLGELEKAVHDGLEANAVVLDWQFLDGKAHGIVPLLEERGVAVAVCSGYGPEERPAELVHIPWVTKPATADAVAEALCAVLDARSANTSV